MSVSHDPWATTTGTRPPPVAAGGPDPFPELRSALRGEHAITAREARILRMRFGLDDCVPLTRDRVGDVFGLPGRRIDQLERFALRDLGLAGLRPPEDRHAAFPGYPVRGDGSPVAGAVRDLRNGHRWWRTDEGLWTDGDSLGTWLVVTGSDRSPSSRLVPHGVVPCRPVRAAGTSVGDGPEERRSWDG